MRRHAIGIVALLLLVAGGTLLALRPSGATWQTAAGATMRIGLVLGALWLAFPQVSRVPPWIYGSLLVAALVVAVRPKMIVWVLPALFFLWLLRPRAGWPPPPKPRYKRKSASGAPPGNEKG